MQPYKKVKGNDNTIKKKGGSWDDKSDKPTSGVPDQFECPDKLRALLKISDDCKINACFRLPPLPGTVVTYYGLYDFDKSAKGAMSWILKLCDYTKNGKHEPSEISKNFVSSSGIYIDEKGNEVEVKYHEVMQEIFGDNKN